MMNARSEVNASDALHPILRIGRRLSFAAAAVSGGPSAKGLAGERSRPSGIGGGTDQTPRYRRVSVFGGFGAFGWKGFPGRSLLAKMAGGKVGRVPLGKRLGG